MCATITNGISQTGSMIGDSLRKLTPMVTVYCPAVLLATYWTVAARIALAAGKTEDVSYATRAGMTVLGIAGTVAMAKTGLSREGLQRQVNLIVGNAKLLEVSVMWGASAAILRSPSTAATLDVGVKVVVILGAAVALSILFGRVPRV